MRFSDEEGHQQRGRPSPKAIALLDGLEAPVLTLDAFRRILWWLFTGSAGAGTRTLVIYAIRENPRNAQQLSEGLQLDYTTVRHHLKVLEKNRIVVTEGDKYGKVYFLSDAMEAHWGELEEMLKGLGSKKRRVVS